MKFKIDDIITVHSVHATPWANLTGKQSGKQYFFKKVVKVKITFLESNDLFKATLLEDAYEGDRCFEKGTNFTYCQKDIASIFDIMKLKYEQFI